MKIGVDVSQLAFENTGVSNYLENLVQALLRADDRNDYVLFFSSLRKDFPQGLKLPDRVKIKTFKLPPTLLDILWNKLHILPIENFIGSIDVFITSDWTEPPAKKAKKATILYDLIVYKYPKETARKIVDVQKRKLKWVKKETDIIFCISEATKKDAQEILGVSQSKLEVIYPGF
jgi:glycosyltransferase involved in cell wall biosynthesis